MRLHDAGIPLLGTSAADIDRAEDRNKFSALLDEIGVDQPKWAHATALAAAGRIVERLGGFPVLVRPSYVLSGAAMSVAHEPNELERILRKAKAVSPEHPVVITRFEEDAREIEIDLVARDGEVVLWAMTEHVEDAGVHSGGRHARSAAGGHDDSDVRPGAPDRRADRPQAAGHRSLQHPDAAPRRDRQGHRMQPAGVAQPALRVQGDRAQLRPRGHAHHARRRPRDGAPAGVGSRARGRQGPTGFRSPGSAGPIPPSASRWRAPARWAALAPRSTKRCSTGCSPPGSGARERACCSRSARFRGNTGSPGPRGSSWRNSVCRSTPPPGRATRSPGTESRTRR